MFNVDLVIDDNPNICRSLVEASRELINRILEGEKTTLAKAREVAKMNLNVIAPHYPAIENQHDKRVLLVKNEVSNLKIEDFSK
jgi:hypothetical protein